MQITFDPDKDKANQEKHGVSLAAAISIEWDTALDWEDTRKDYQEKRICSPALIEDRVYYVVYVDRGEVRRIISLRKANSREARKYVDET
jgi:uncharacterized DUF497 family protein